MTLSSRPLAPHPVSQRCTLYETSLDLYTSYYIPYSLQLSLQALSVLRGCSKTVLKAGTEYQQLFFARNRTPNLGDLQAERLPARNMCGQAMEKRRLEGKYERNCHRNSCKSSRRVGGRDVGLTRRKFLPTPNEIGIMAFLWVSTAVQGTNGGA